MIATAEADTAYVLDDQVGFVLRQVQQRHATIFAAAFGEEFTPTQWAVVAKLAEVGECSQNLLGRHVAMDAATVKGVVERLERRGFLAPRPDPDDRRRLLLRLSDAGLDAFRSYAGRAAEVTDDTLAPLGRDDRTVLLSLLRRLR